MSGYNLRIVTREGGRMTFVEPDFTRVLLRLARLDAEGLQVHSVSAARRLDESRAGTTKL